MKARLILGAVVGLITAAVCWWLLAVTVLVLGGTECDRGACNGLGEFASAHQIVTALGMGAVALTVGALVGWSALHRR